MDLFTFIQCCLFGNVLLVSIALSLLLSLLSSHHVFFKLITFITFLTIFATPIVNFILQSNNSSYWFWSLVFSCWVDAKLSKSICLFGTIFTWDFLNSFSTWNFFSLSNIKTLKLITDYTKTEGNVWISQILRWREDDIWQRQFLRVHTWACESGVIVTI